MNYVRDAAFIKAMVRFLPYDGVIGVGFGPKLKKGKIMRSDAIVVLVTKKLKEEEVPKDQQIPQFYEGFPVDVQVPTLTITKPQEKKIRMALETEYEWIDWGKIHRIHQIQQSIAVDLGKEPK